MAIVYVIGSLRNPCIPQVSKALRDAKHEVFDDWHAAGPEADDCWKRYEQERGRTYIEALSGYAARHVFDFDKLHLDRCDTAVLVLPAGKSGHLELGYMLGKGKRGFVLLEESNDRWDVMYQFATGVAVSLEKLVELI